MAIPRFSFGSGASGLYNPNQILVPTKLTSADKTQLSDYDKKIADYKAQVDAYNKAVEAHNKSGTGTFSQKEPTDPGITQKEIDTFGTESAARAQQLQTARQNALNILQNPEGFSSYYGIGSLGFEEGGEVPVNFVGTGEFPETDPSVGYRTGPASQDKELPLIAELIADSIPVAGKLASTIYARQPLDNVTPEQTYQVASFVPGPAEAIGAKETYDAAKQGNFLEAGITGAATLAGLFGGIGPTKRLVKEGTEQFLRAATKKSPSLDTLKAKPEAIASSDSNAFEVLGITKDSKEAWRDANRLPNKNKPPEENRQALIEQVKLLEEGKSTPNEFRKYVDTKTPYFLHDSVPEVDSFERIANSLPQESSILRNGIIGVNKQIPEGTLVGSRYDVNAFQDFGTYVGTIHDPAKQGKVFGYSPTAALKNVVFETKEGASLKIAKGNPKSPVIRMEGNWVEHSPEELRALAVEALEQNKNLPLVQQEWVQVGINPAKGASWVALEKTADGVKSVPITGADEVIQIGKLVLARKPKLQSWDDYYKTASFEDGGAVSEGIGSLMQDNRYQEAKVFDLDYAEDAERYNYREELEQLNPSFMVGRYNIRPNISGSYQRSSVDIPENVDGKNVFINKKYKSGGGNLGFNVITPNQHNFGAGASGNYFTGSMEFPEEIQAFGAPAKINYGEGLTPQNYYAYYNTPEGLSISGNYREGNPDQKSALGIMLSKQIKFKNIEDLTKRIARLFKGK